MTLEAGLRLTRRLDATAVNVTLVDATQLPWYENFPGIAQSRCALRDGCCEKVTFAIQVRGVTCAMHGRGLRM